ncbi:MAG: AEC family transporter [Candidatus Hydrogenedentes bacterium]|nr:AEC family transporter [Candidatus Hydrogenedentota bacterium]
MGGVPLAVLSAVVPVFLVAGTGYLAGRKLPLDVRTLSSLNIYLFIPALIFANLSKSAIEWALFARCALGVFFMTMAMIAILTALARARRMAQEDRSAFLMTLFPNLGNFGLPVVRFAFGEEALALALVILVCGSLLQNSIGVYFAQRHRHGVLDAAKRVFRFPMIYAFALALVFQRTGWEVPEAAFRAIRLVADAAIPVQLIILGVKLAETRLEKGADVFLAVGTRLCVGPLVAWGVVAAVGLSGISGKVFILQMSTPVAVAMAVYGVQFNVKPTFLASVVSWSFLLSLVTVSAVLWILYALPS